MQRSGRWVVAAGMLAAGVLAGCDASSDEPTTSPTPTPSVSSASPTPTASPSPSVTESGLQIPAAAREKTDAGAEAFVRYYLDQSAVAWMKPDASALDGLATASCNSCARLDSVAAQLVADGQRYSTTPIAIRTLKVIRSSSSEVAFDAALTENAVSVVDAKGSKVDSYPRRNITRAISVVWKGESWRLNGIGE